MAEAGLWARLQGQGGLAEHRDQTHRKPAGRPFLAEDQSIAPVRRPVGRISSTSSNRRPHAMLHAGGLVRSADGTRRVVWLTAVVPSP